MKTIVLQRTESSDQGTFGVMNVGGHTLFTGELPWRDNANDLSCIPAGTYRCAMTYSPHFRRRLYLVDHVSHRAGVRIHSACLMGDTAKGFVSQLLGCIALGEKRGFIGNQKAILVSRSAVRKFEKALNNEPFILEVRDALTAS